MFPTAKLLALSFATMAYGQQVGTQQAEKHPTMSSQKCTKSGGCINQQTSIVLDANWRWLHTTSGYTNCYTGNTWDTSLCPDGQTCASNCALDGADYSGTYGITTSGMSGLLTYLLFITDTLRSGNALTLKFVTGKNIGSRVYLLASDTKYQMFKLLNQEFSFDVDMSNVRLSLHIGVFSNNTKPCGSSDAA
jgi:cellulose 1,4-beta-cellobiosidase